MTYVDALFYVDERLAQKPCVGTDCDLDAPCKRHDRVIPLAARLWRLQLARDRRARS